MVSQEGLAGAQDGSPEVRDQHFLLQGSLCENILRMVVSALVHHGVQNGCTTTNNEAKLDSCRIELAGPIYKGDNISPHSKFDWKLLSTATLTQDQHVLLATAKL